MNLFFLDIDPKKCAIYHCDKHVVKMILEMCQMMYTAHHMLKTPVEDLPTDYYRPFNPQHPTAVWIRLCVENYTYAAKVAVCLAEEYTFRYNRIHSCEKHARWLFENQPKFKIINEPYHRSKKDVTLTVNKIFEANGMTPIPLAMPEESFKNDPIKSYRNYYKLKKNFAKWSKRNNPWWFTYYLSF